MISKKLNLGCGHHIRQSAEGWINLDIAKLSGVDIVWDIEKLPLPFKDAEFDEILAEDILEHTEYIPVLRDLHRILKTGGKLTVRVPHFTSKNNFADPTHKKMFSVATFDFFTQNPAFSKSKERDYYFDFHFNRIVSSKITFEKSSRFFFYNKWIVEPIINLNTKTRYLYEATFLARLFPAENIVVELMK